MAYGYETEEENDPLIFAGHNCLAYANETTQPGYLIELIPWRMLSLAASH